MYLLQVSGRTPGFPSFPDGLLQFRTRYFGAQATSVPLFKMFTIIVKLDIDLHSKAAMRRDRGGTGRYMHLLIGQVSDAMQLSAELQTAVAMRVEAELWFDHEANGCEEVLPLRVLESQGLDVCVQHPSISSLWTSTI